MKATQNNQSKKLIVVLAICFLFLIVSEFIISQNINYDFSRLMLDQRKSSVSKMVHLAYHSIQPIIEEVHNGEINSEEAREKITTLVRNMTYEDEYGKNYIFMSSYDGIMLVQPFEPQKEGSDQWDLKDSNGIYIIRGLVQAAKENPKGAFFAYAYYLPNENRIEEKLSFVIGIPEIEAYIGTGMYLESSYKELQRILELQRYGFLIMTIFILGAATFYILSLYKTNQRLSKEIRERMYAESNIRTVFDSIHDAVMIHDHHGNIILANKQVSLLYGIPEDQITKYNIRELSSSDKIAQDKLAQTKDLDHSALVFEWRCRRPVDGAFFDGEVALRKSMWSGKDVIVAAIRDISERKKHEEEVRYLAYYDYLTSLNNRVYIMNELSRQLSEENTDNATGAVLFIDLDNFKKINDSFGHFFGDEVLIQLANKLKELTSNTLLPARIGGDEFVLLCKGLNLTQVIEIVEQTLEIFRSPISLHDNTINLTCSIGIALFPKDGRTVKEIFKNADMAMYNAKYQGKTSIVSMMIQ